MTIVIIAIVAALIVGHHIGAGHTHHRYRKAAGLRPNFFYSSVMGPYVSIRLPGGFRVGHRL
jgi:hypothetical protein